MLSARPRLNPIVVTTPPLPRAFVLGNFVQACCWHVARLPQAADLRQRVDDVRPNLQQTELEHLEQAHRSGADDDGIGFDGRGGGGHRLLQKQKRLAQVGPAQNRLFISMAALQRFSSGSLLVRWAHASWSGNGSLRLVSVL